MTKFSLFALIAVLAAPSATVAFAPIQTPAFAVQTRHTNCVALFAEGEATEAVFKSDEEEAAPSSLDSSEGDASLDAVEKLGRGAAKAKRGKRKGSTKDQVKEARKAAATLVPEEVFYEGPPAITETLAPTLSILTVVGIVPAAAAWARQAWVRYKITTRRIRVTSGINGKDMAEIVFPDIIEIRTAKRLFGDGDLVAFLRDGAKFEMRNIPNFDEAMVFILDQVDPAVATEYRAKGDVTKP
eukprot:scaffold61496_cov41-Attheya_sp.AAC.1